MRWSTLSSCPTAGAGSVPCSVTVAAGLDAWHPLRLAVRAVANADASAGVANVIGYVDLQPVFGLAQGEPNAGLQLLTSAICWIVLPLSAGLWRTLRNDI